VLERMSVICERLRDAEHYQGNLYLWRIAPQPLELGVQLYNFPLLLVTLEVVSTFSTRRERRRLSSRRVGCSPPNVSQVEHLEGVATCEVEPLTHIAILVDIHAARPEMPDVPEFRLVASSPLLGDG
jgi:hypothetical protein